MDLGTALLAKIAALDEIDDAHFPIVSIDDYFLGNEQEESIAPNQWGYGRPSIGELYARLKEIEARPDVQGVFVGIHQDWTDAERLGDWAPAENIHIYSSAPQEIADRWIDGWQSDGISPGWPYGKHAAAPEPLAGYQVFTIYWD
ncbi:hypothetical protein SAMN05216588_12648 [Pseudomonas flavescens]|uniref:Uncharacterized protein n=1 Tax=Phytopseudomonas flavescens TaxID=29435 RepID=A0A1G8NXK3_9GAMM|nr:hypothetical protein [Pseudomonas flavescens]SDI84748.1 hypothetical protein SAMN05216588_12648 [Pseudomonas flavescens]